MKAWCSDIERKIQELAEMLKPRGLHWWPKFVYHSTDVRNAAKILETGFLYSRIEAKNRNLMIVDNASPGIIDKTSMESMQFARLYFRPRTPFQHNNEGIRPKNQRIHDAHSPIPIFFCFNALQVLSLETVQFSNGNLAKKGVRYGGDREFYLQIPFQDVFHEGPFPEERRDTIVFHRHAEVLVPNFLEIENLLKYVICRSPAEAQTLMTLLSNKVAKQWKELIRLDNKNRFFYRQWTFVDTVPTTPGRLIFRFNPNTKTPGPFEAKVTYEENGKAPRHWQGQIVANEKLELPIKDATQGVLTLELDDALAFKGRVIFKRTVV